MPSVATMPKKSEDQYSEKEAAARFEAALKSAMNRPPPRRGTEGQLILFRKQRERARDKDGT